LRARGNRLGRGGVCRAAGRTRWHPVGRYPVRSNPNPQRHGRA
jgi:hypothetical protein